jgi:isochorismate hydrolase
MEDIFRIDKEKAVLVIIEVQTALVRAMDSGVMSNVLRNLQILISFARELGIPMMATEQYPKGLGQTVPEIKQAWGSVVPLEKMAFSCCHVEAFNERLQHLGRRQILLTGMEAHVCVLQTAADLIQGGYEVHVVADGVCSRKKFDWKMGLRWMEKKGATITTTEIVAFQLLKEAGTEEFRKLSKYLK